MLYWEHPHNAKVFPKSERSRPILLRLDKMYSNSDNVFIINDFFLFEVTNIQAAWISMCLLPSGFSLYRDQECRQDDLFGVASMHAKSDYYLCRTLL